MFCSHCGKNNSDDNAYCEYCGRLLTEQGQRAAFRCESDKTRDIPYIKKQLKTSWQWSRPYHPIVVGLLVSAILISGAIAYACVVSQGQGAVGQGASKQTAESEEEEVLSYGIKDGNESEAVSSDGYDDSSEKAEASLSDTSTNNSPETSISSQPATGTDAASANTDYFLPESDSRYYSESELNSFSDWELYLARNEIFARHGRMFSNEDLKNYFEAKSWYEPRYTPEEFDSLGDDVVNEYEKANSQTILSIEQARNSQYVS